MTTSGSNGRARHKDGKPLRWVIESTFAEGSSVQHAITEAVEKSRFSTDDVFAVKLALEEAIINAIKHGNKFDPKKTVTVEAKVTPRQVEIVIEDQGPGFDRKRVPDPTLDENLEKCSGRGILLIESYMDKVEYSNGGRRVRMIKKNKSR